MCRILKKRVLGLMLLSMGIGMLLVLVVPYWGLFIALGAIAAGVFLIFTR